jgi:hypothetical protein
MEADQLTESIPIVVLSVAIIVMLALRDCWGHSFDATALH